MKIIRKFSIIVFIILLFCSCDKFLSERPNYSISNPNTIEDLIALLDADNRINSGNYSVLGEGATDDFFLGSDGLNRLSDFYKSIYYWEPYLQYRVADENVGWGNPFRVIGIANTVIDEIPYVKKKLNQENIVKGTALFHRAFSYLSLAQTYCKAYDPLTSKNDLGLPLRLESDINLPSVRSSVYDTYNQIILDAKIASELLPVHSDFRTRPTKAAAYALLSRAYLIMENYDNALMYSDKALHLVGNNLIDYNEVDGSKRFPFEPMNKETIFFAFGNGASAIDANRECYVDTLLIKSYEENDLRKKLFFSSENNGYFTFRGSYRASSSSSFNGLTVSELLLISAECNARKNNTDLALQSLNKLLLYRFKKGQFVPIMENNAERLLFIVLHERRKEMLFRGQRWSDLKRLNRDPRFAKSIYRKLNDGTLVELPPNDPRYTLQIPQSVIDLTGMEQN